MDPVTFIAIPGFLGGLVIAVFVILWQRRARRGPTVVVTRRQAGPSTDVINMSSIKVAGVGGLGLVAMATAVALDVPRIGETMAIGLVLGAVIAVAMIVRRRKTGSMPSSGRGFGANTTLRIDAPAHRERPHAPIDPRATAHDPLPSAVR